MPGPLMGAEAAFSSQVAHANSTLNKFMPGRQKAWMTNTTTPETPSSGMPPRPPSQQSPAQPGSRQAAAPQQPAAQKDGRPSYQPTEADLSVLPSPAPSDELSLSGPNTKDSSNPAPVSLPAGLLGRRDMVDATAATDATVPLPTGRQDNVEAGDDGHAASPNGPGPLPPPPPTARIGEGPRIQVQAESTGDGEPPGKRRRVGLSDHSADVNNFDFTHLVRYLDRTLAASESGMFLLRGLEEPRVRLLRDACVHRDIFYLCLHSLFCLWSLDPASLPPFPPQDRDAVFTGFAYLETILRPNAGLTEGILRWAARFPNQGLYTLVPQVVEKTTAFLASLTRHWAALTEHICQRGYPCLVDELLVKIKCESYVMQKLLFTVCRRRLGFQDGHASEKLEPIFAEDLRGHCDEHGVLRSLSLPDSEAGAVMARRNAVLIQKYRDTIAEIQATGSCGEGNRRQGTRHRMGVGSQVPLLEGAQQQQAETGQDVQPEAHHQQFTQQPQQHAHDPHPHPQQQNPPSQHQNLQHQHLQLHPLPRQAQMQQAYQQAQMQRAQVHQAAELQRAQPQRMQQALLQQGQQEEVGGRQQQQALQALQTMQTLQLQGHLTQQEARQQTQEQQQPPRQNVAQGQQQSPQQPQEQQQQQQQGQKSTMTPQAAQQAQQLPRLQVRTTPYTVRRLPPLRDAGGGVAFNTTHQHMPHPGPQWPPRHMQNAMPGHAAQNALPAVSYSARLRPSGAPSGTESPIFSLNTYGAPLTRSPTVTSSPNQGPRHSLFSNSLASGGPVMQRPAMQRPVVQGTVVQGPVTHAAVNPQQHSQTVPSPQQGQFNAPQQVHDDNQLRIQQLVPSPMQYQAQWAAGQNPGMMPNPRTPAMRNPGPIQHGNGFVPALPGGMRQPCPQPRPEPGAQTSPSIPQNGPVAAENGAHHQVSRLVQARGLVIDRRSYPNSPATKRSLLMSLHQAHARSPDRTRRAGQPDERYYQSVQSFALPPFRIIYHHDLQLEISPEQASRACRRKASAADARLLTNVCEYADGSLRFRARCCRLQSDGPVQESDWVFKEVLWPEHIFLDFNGHKLPIRRGTHNGKDLAAELTDHVLPGKNELKVTVPHAGPTAADKKGNNFYLAVEIIETVSHSRALKQIEENHRLDLEKTLDKIRVRVTAAPDEDGIAVIDRAGDNARELSIDLTDPFTSKIFHIPARGVACTHMECFDLETWLNTRPAKQRIKCSHQDVCTCCKRLEPSDPDKWKCPICFLDARPGSLYIDSFLDGVRQQLERQNKLDTKSILVAADGSWRPVDKPRDGSGGGHPADRPQSMSTGTTEPTLTAPTERGPVEIIEID